MDMNSHQIVMPWPQLTDITLSGGSSPETVLGILAQCVCLVKASIDTIGWLQLPQARTDFMALTHLRILSLNFLWKLYFMPLLDRLSVPALEELCLDFGDMHRTQPWTEAHFTPFQLRSPNITRLELNYSSLTSSDLRAALRLAPCLTHLKLAYCDQCFDDTLINALYYKDGVEPLVPHIHNLVVEGIEENEFAETNLAGMIASRWWADDEVTSLLALPTVARWRFVQLGTTKFSQHFLDIVEDLRRKGLDIQTSSW